MRIKRISIKAILLIGLVLLVSVPLAVLRFIVWDSARLAMEKKVTALTGAYLKQAQVYFNANLQQLEQMITYNQNLSAVTWQNGEPQSGWSLYASLDHFDRAYFIDASSGLAFRYNQVDEKMTLSPLTMRGGRESFALLRENPGKVYCLGALPFLADQEIHIWMVSWVNWGGHEGVLALALESKLTADWLQVTSDSVSSKIFLVTVDNQILTNYQGSFFNQDYAPQALERLRQGTLINFSAIHRNDNGSEDVLVHAYADPDYLYSLVAVTPRTALSAAVSKSIDVGVIHIGVAALLVGLFSFWSILLLMRRLAAISNSFRNFTAGNFNPISPKNSFVLIETEQLYQGVQDLAHKLQETVGALQQSQSNLSLINQDLEIRVSQRTNELEKTMLHLRQSSEVMIQSEKMAALGRSLAIFIHEMNNPLGLGLTTLDRLQELAVELNQEYTAGALTEEVFKQKLAELLQLSGMSKSNLFQAVSITQRFGHLANDQTQTQDRRYFLREYLAELLASLQAQLRKANVVLTWVMEAEIVMWGNPADWYQIISNLVLNSINHAFPGMNGGAIHFSVQLTAGGSIYFRYTDNGQGMDQTVLSRIYEPFFTTSKDKGGSGIGMHVVYDIVTRQFGGTIVCHSQPGQGVRFDIEVPHKDQMETLS